MDEEGAVEGCSVWLGEEGGLAGAVEFVMDGWMDGGEGGGREGGREESGLPWDANVDVVLILCGICVWRSAIVAFVG